MCSRVSFTRGANSPVQELVQQGGSNDIRLAMESLQEVTEAVDAAVAAQELPDAEAAMLEGLDEPGKLVVKGLGKVLLFDYADVIRPNDGQIMKVSSTPPSTNRMINNWLT